MKHKTFSLSYILCFYVFFGHQCVAQLQVSGNSTPSICYNDGSITASASGGSIPYTFVITDGPLLAGMSYPVLPTNGVNEFLSIPSGNYNLIVIDNNGDTSATTITVPGSYAFPIAFYNVVNDFDIHVTASLGRPPYRYAISATASNGPFSPEQASSVFDTLCNGTYYVRIFDSCDNIYTTTGIVINRQQVNAQIVCDVNTDSTHSFFVNIHPQTGTPPFTYIYTSDGQMDSSYAPHFTIPGRCYDTVLVTDKCGVLDWAYNDCVPLLGTKVLCSDFETGYVHLLAEGGGAPYTYTYYLNGNAISYNTSGIFDSLPLTVDGYNFRINDACGRMYDLYVAAMRLVYSPSCPFNSNISIDIWGTVELPVQLVCNSCASNQTLTSIGSSSYILANATGGYYDFTLTDSCGIPVYVALIIDTGPVDIIMGWESCNDVHFNTSAGGNSVTSLSSFALTGNNGYYKQNNTGIFPNLPDGDYQIVASYFECSDNSLFFSVPHFPEFCMYPTFDVQCNRAYDLKIKNISDDFAEQITIGSLFSGTLQNETPAGANNGIFYNDIRVGTHTILSDSGCTAPFVLPIHPDFILTAYDSVDCLDRQYLTIICNPAYLVNNCQDTTFFFKRIYKNEVLVVEGIGEIFLVPDSGEYVIKLFYKPNFPYPPIPYAFNDSCFVDSIHISARPKTLPEVFASDMQVCGMSSVIDIPYKVTGGVLPYTLNVPSVGVFSVQDTIGILQAMGVDNYTFIAYDNCGISNSITVSVVDTCFECGKLSSFIADDTILCVGESVVFIDTAMYVQEYTWYINNIQVSNNDSLIYVFTNAGQYLVRCVAANISCIDTTELLVTVTAKDSFYLGPDIRMCSGESALLSALPDTVFWFDGSYSSSYTAYISGIYVAYSINHCGYYYDSVMVMAQSVAGVELGPDLELCAGDSLLIGLTLSYDSVRWNDGSTTASRYVYQAGTYAVIAYDDGCFASDFIEITNALAAPMFSLGNDTSFCSGFSISLSTPYPNTIWSVGFMSNFINVTEEGLYWAMVQSQCGIFSDSIFIANDNISDLEIGPDAITCDSFFKTAIVNTDYDSVRWSNGSTLHYAYLLSTGTYSVTVTKGRCIATDTINITNYKTPQLQINENLSFCGQEAMLETGLNGVTYLWSDSTVSKALLVIESGVYGVTVSNACGTDSALTEVLLLGDECKLALPTAFTPNGDGKNDTYAPISLCDINEFAISIYNRWGALVYYSADALQGWSGNYNAEAQPVGTYIVYVKYFDNCEQRMNVVQQEITLMR